MQTFDYKEFVLALDKAQQAHFEWNRRILRCAVLHTLPDKDVIDQDAHLVCDFGRFLIAHEIAFTSINPECAEQLFAVHQTMHDAIRQIALPISQGQAGAPEDLCVFESSQATLIEHLQYFKTQAVYSYAQIDSLTELPLRQRLIKDFESQQRKCNGGNMALLFLDVDHFKSVNDVYGHNMGDEVLRSMAHHIHHHLNEQQTLYRYGGEEFVILVCDQGSPESVAEFAEQIRCLIHKTPIPLMNGENIHISATIGVAQAQGNEVLTSLIERADQAMYKGKRLGRNRVVEADSVD